jgi:hypothetical protein
MGKYCSWISGANVASNNLSNATAIGFGANVAASNTIQLGNTSVTNLITSGKVTAGAITYPNVDGTNGQVLSTTGSGTLFWITPLSSSVPYIGAASQVDLNAQSLVNVNNVSVSTANNYGQTGIGTFTPNASAILDETSTIQGFYLQE